MRTENFALDSLSATRRLCRGFKLRSHVVELVTQILTPRPQGPSVEFAHRLIVPAILTICLTKKVKNSATEDHGFLCSIHCPSPTLDSFDVFYRSNKETFTTRPYAKQKQEECITFMMRRNKIMWASFRQ